MGWIDSLFDTEGFPPRWECGDAWTPLLGWTHIIADLAIFVAYVTIPATIWLFLRRRRDMRFPKAVWLLVAFIFSCGCVHFVESVIFWNPLYRLSAVLKVLTAGFSLASAIVFAYFMPRFLRLPGRAAIADELEKTNDDLKRSNRDLEAFAYVTSHDLSSPLGAIDGYLDLVAEGSGSKLDEEDQEFLELARNATGRMQGMIDSILEFSRVQRNEIGALTQVEPAAILEELSQLKRDAGDDFDLVVGKLPALTTSKLYLERILTNLLENAVKYTDERARIEVQGERSSDAQTVVLRMRDHGIGIPANQRKRVFQLFQRLHPSDRFEGSGIGLAMCRRIAERLGGSLDIVETEGPGTTFELRLPDHRD